MRNFIANYPVRDNILVEARQSEVRPVIKDATFVEFSGYVPPHKSFEQVSSLVVSKWCVWPLNYVAIIVY
jgi:hypothetical protein